MNLTAEEQLLVLLYRTVSEPTRARARHLLFEAWTHPLPEDRAEQALRFRLASDALGPWLTVQVFESFAK